MARTTKEYDLATGMLTIYFESGAIKYDIYNLPEDVKKQLTLHGASQLLGDTYAAETDTLAYYKHANARYAGLMEGTWSTKGAGLDMTDKLDELKASLLVPGTSELVLAVIGKEIKAIERKIAKAKA